MTHDPCTLYDPLPTSVTIAGREVPIRTDFRAGIQCETLLREPEPDVCALVGIYFGSEWVPPTEEDLAAGLKAILWFYRCGEPEDCRTGAENKKAAAVYSYEHDAPYIYAAFLDQYSIDLQTAALHWWQFRALFRGLRDDNEIVKIMQIRGAKLTREMGKAQKAQLRRLKRLYRLPDTRTPEQRDLDNTAALASLF